jgi:hypothetical protein
VYDAPSRNAVCGATCTHPTDNIQSLVRPPVPVALNGAAGYADRFGTAPRSPIDFGAIVACPERGQRMAALYAAAPTYDRAALPAYCAFRDETADQFAYLTAPVARGGLGVAVVRTDVDPYPDAVAMMTDLLEHRRLQVFATAAGDNPHPLLTDDENDMFRAVHDFFGHASTGRGFDRHGEEGAWVKHAGMYSPLARRAMTTETRATNSSLIWTYAGERFPEQKAALLPPAFCDPAQFSSRPA